MRPKTIIVDIDGTLLVHQGNMSKILDGKASLLHGAREKLNEWDAKGYNIILMTGRRESAREFTEKQLSDLGLFWDQLIMGVGGGQRVLINDLKDDPEFGDTAVAIQVERNKGIKDVDV